MCGYLQQTATGNCVLCTVRSSKDGTAFFAVNMRVQIC